MRELAEAADGLPLVVVGDGPLRSLFPQAVGFVPPRELGPVVRAGGRRRRPVAARGLRHGRARGDGVRPAGRRDGGRRARRRGRGRRHRGCSSRRATPAALRERDRAPPRRRRAARAPRRGGAGAIRRTSTAATTMERAPRASTPRSQSSAAANERPEHAEPVERGELLALLARARLVRDRHLVDPLARHAARGRRSPARSRSRAPGGAASGRARCDIALWQVMTSEIQQL